MCEDLFQKLQVMCVQAIKECALPRLGLLLSVVVVVVVVVVVLLLLPLLLLLTIIIILTLLMLLILLLITIITIHTTTKHIKHVSIVMNIFVKLQVMCVAAIKECALPRFREEQ